MQCNAMQCNATQRNATQHNAMHAYIHPCMHACIHTYICTYVHMYIWYSIYIYIYLRLSLSFTFCWWWKPESAIEEQRGFWWFLNTAQMVKGEGEYFHQETCDSFFLNGKNRFLLFKMGETRTYAYICSFAYDPMESLPRTKSLKHSLQTAKNTIFEENISQTNVTYY